MSKKFPGKTSSPLSTPTFCVDFYPSAQTHPTSRVSQVLSEWTKAMELFGLLKSAISGRAGTRVELWSGTGGARFCLHMLTTGREDDFEKTEKILAPLGDWARKIDERKKKLPSPAEGQVVLIGQFKMEDF